MEQMMNAEELGNILSKTPETIRRWARAGKLPHVKIHGLRLVRLSELADEVASTEILGRFLGVEPVRFGPEQFSVVWEIEKAGLRRPATNEQCQFVRINPPLAAKPDGA